MDLFVVDNSETIVMLNKFVTMATVLDAKNLSGVETEEILIIFFRLDTNVFLLGMFLNMHLLKELRYADAAEQINFKVADWYLRGISENSVFAYLNILSI